MLPRPVGKEKGRKTHGRWRDEADGKLREAITSGRGDGLHEEALGMLDALGFPRQAAAMAEHVEIKLIALMRRLRTSDATLVINNRPCGWDNPDWLYACDNLIPRVLYPGQRMTVEGVDEYGQRISRTYEGART